jgi:hypothetical protein
MGNRDANHPDGQRWYEELWCLVHDTHALGGGFPALVVRISTAMGTGACRSESCGRSAQALAGDVPAALGHRLR